MCKMQGTLEVGALVAIANDVDDAVFNSNEAETYEKLLEAEGRGNGGKSALFNLKDTAISYDLLNPLWLLQMISLETFVELNIDLAIFRFPFSTRCDLSE